MLVGGDGVGDEAGTGLDVDGVGGRGIRGVGFGDDHGAEGDAGVHVLVVVDVADGTGVGAAFGGFKFVDDLHGADFGGAGDGADGEGEAEGVEEGFIGGEFSGDVGDDVHDVGVAFDGEDVGDFDGAEFGGAADVVAAEVDEHDVFGAFFGVGEEFGFEGLILFVGFAAGAGAGEGAVGDDAVLDAAHDFGAGADEDAVGAGEVEHEGAGIDDAEGAVDVEGSGGGGGLEALGEDDLEDVAGLDVFLSGADGLFILGLGHVGGVGGAEFGGEVDGTEFEGERGLEVVDEGVDAGDGGVIGGAQELRTEGGGLSGGDVGVGDDEDGFLDVVEDDGFVIEAEEEVGEVAIIGRAGGEFFGFEVADGVVAGVADGAADEGGEGGAGGEFYAVDGGEEGFEVLEGICGGEGARGDGGIGGEGLEGDEVIVGFDEGVGGGGEEGVAGDAFAADDGFEEEGVG